MWKIMFENYSLGESTFVCSISHCDTVIASNNCKLIVLFCFVITDGVEMEKTCCVICDGNMQKGNCCGTWSRKN